MDTIENLYSGIVQDGKRGITGMIKRSVSESPILDFKQSFTHDGYLTKDDKENLGKALSGFANSEGGIIVWGVKCMRVANQPDVASSPSPIPKITAFTADLESLTGQLVSPGVIGVRHAPIRSSARSAAGFAVSYVPQADATIHMAMAQGQQRFYFRAGSSFLPMPAWMVIDRISRRPPPKLEFFCEITGYDDDVDIVVGISNEGRGIAQYPALTIGFSEPSAYNRNVYGLNGNGGDGIPMLSQSYHNRERDGITFAGGVNDVIHSGVVLQVTKLRLDKARVKSIQQSGQDNGIRLPYQIRCEGFHKTDVLEIDYYKYHDRLNSGNWMKPELLTDRPK